MARKYLISIIFFEGMTRKRIKARCKLGHQSTANEPVFEELNNLLLFDTHPNYISNESYYLPQVLNVRRELAKPSPDKIAEIVVTERNIGQAAHDIGQVAQWIGGQIYIELLFFFFAFPSRK